MLLRLTAVYSKTEAMWLGAWRSRTDQPYGLTWVSKMKILGVVFGHETESDNWQPKLKKLEIILIYGNRASWGSVHYKHLRYQ